MPTAREAAEAVEVLEGLSSEQELGRHLLEEKPGSHLLEEEIVCH
jgi:hypothetical protein